MSNAKPKLGSNRPGSGTVDAPVAPPPTADPSTGIARRLMRSADRGVLSTSLPRTEDAHSADIEGWPYASLVLITADHDLSPIFLLSDLAEHTRNLQADPRATLLIDGTTGHEDPLSAPRLSVLGRIRRIDERSGSSRYLAHHPSAALYASFADFHFYRMTVERAHLVAGFGRIRWLEAAEFGLPAPAALVRSERMLIEALNNDVNLLKRLAARAGVTESNGWRIAGLDRDGLDLRQSGQSLRLWFDQPVTTPDEALAALQMVLRRR